MRFIFVSRRLEKFYTEEKDPRLFPPGIADSFFEVMDIIRAAKNLQDIRAFKSLRYEKLKGKRKDQHSLRLNNKYRLIIIEAEDENGSYLEIINIEDYH